MDNLTHSLAGALLGQMGLKRKTGLAMPTLIIAANIPDIDAVAVLLGGHQHLAIRRGLTHGPIAWVVLPLLLWGAMLWFDRWQARRGKRPEKRLPVHKGWLLALAFMGCLTHPALDWLNSYGIRLLEPFSHKWFYGDSIFIVDVWMLAIMGLGLWLSMRRERLGREDWRRPAKTAFIAVFVYINANATISAYAVTQTTQALTSRVGLSDIQQIVANPVPLAFWRREMLFGSPNNYYRSSYSLFSKMEPARNFQEIEISKHATHIVDVQKLTLRNKDLSAFLFWSRMPYDALIETNGKREAVFRDARFSNPLVQDRFTVATRLLPTEEVIDISQAATCKDSCK